MIVSENSIIKKPRIEYIDLAKGICITLVVCFHLTLFYDTSLPCDNFFKAFRMPLYFFLSGCFFKAYEGFGGFVKRKINKLLIPFAFFFLVCSFIIPNILAHYGVNIRYLPMSEMFSALLDEYYPSGQIWFLLCLFEINVFFYVIYLFSGIFEKRTLVLVMISLLFGLCGIILSLKGIDIPANLDTALSALPFFAVGYVIFRHTDMLKPNRFDRYLPLMIIGAFALVYLVSPNVSFLENQFYGHSWLTAYPFGTLGVLGVIWLSKLLKRLPILTYYGRYSIIILVTHDTVFHFIAAVLNRFELSLMAELSLNLLLTMASYLVIIPFMRKYMPHVTAQKDVLL